jgi:hypothetical protein
VSLVELKGKVSLVELKGKVSLVSGEGIERESELIRFLEQ